MPELEAAYARLLKAGGRAAALNFREQVGTDGMVAATNPWQPPTGDLVDGNELEQDAAAAIAPIHRRILKAVSPAGDLGIAFDVKHPTSQALLSGIGKRLGSLSAAIRTQVNETVAQGHDEGWSVARTAKAITAKVDEVTPGRAAMLARSDLNSLSNGASLASAQAVGVDSKTWLATGDDKTRETHAEADGQTVPLDQPFTVGGEQGMYPGDPDLSDEEAANCRCTLTYADGVTAAVSLFEEAMNQAPILLPAAHLDPFAIRPSTETFATPEGGEMDEQTALAAISGDLETLDNGALNDLITSATNLLARREILTFSEFTLIAAAGPGEPTRWVAPAIAVENQPTEDGRILMPDSTTWRIPPLPLGVMIDTPHGDLSAAPLAGCIDTFERIGPVIAAGGYFNDNLDHELAPDLVQNALQAIEGIKSRSLTGISVDLMVLEGAMIQESSLNTDGEDELPPEVGENLAMLDPYPDAAPVEAEDDLAEPDADDSRWLSAVYQGVIGGACIVPIAAIGNASISVVAAGYTERYVITSPLFPDCGCDDEESEDVLVAAALPDSQGFPVVAPLVPPAEWFEDPKLDKPTPLTITNEGRVFGHVAPEGVCHEGFRSRCVLAPRSRMGYRKFMNGEIPVMDGSRINVGKLTLRAGHAGTRGISEAAAKAHYDNTATIAAFVRAGDDRHGIWVAGSLKSTATPEVIQELMSSPLSGDWRDGELIAAHAVIDPGFPVLRASGLGELLEDDEEAEPISPLSYLRPTAAKVA